MSAPRRIQLKRTRGWKKPANAVVVSRPSKWGNPYLLESYEVRGLPPEKAERAAREMLVRDFERALYENSLPYSIADVRRELRGKSLCCWCPLPAPGEPDLCHAAVLLKVANS